jgi:hypothetical protein
MASLFQPRRGSPSTNNGATATDLPLLDSVSLFTWEDAIDLYHGFEWQESASSFFQLSRTVNDEERKTQCLLNAAIIYARMKKHRKAANVLEEISTTGDALALTLFLMGHVKYAMGACADAEQCFRIALDQLDGKNAKFSDLDFVLKPSHINLDLDAIKHAESNLVKPARLSLPADGVLKPVSRPSLQNPSFKRNSQSFSKRDGTVVIVHPESPSSDVTIRAGPPSPGLPKTPIESVEYSSGDLKYHNMETENVKKPDSSAQKPVSSLRSLSTMVRRISYRHPSKATATSEVGASCTPPVPTRTRPTHTARDARGIGQSVRELTNFIRHLPANDEKDATALPSDASTLAVADATASSARGSVSSSLPGLTDHESLSDKSTHSTIDSKAASIQSIEAAIHSGSESPDADLAVPFKNPIRRVVAMERAHKLLAEQSRVANAETTPRTNHAKISAAVRPVTFIDEVMARPSMDFTIDKNSFEAPRKPPPTPARSSVRYSSPTSFPTKSLPPVPPPTRQLPAIPQGSPQLPPRRRPMLTERTLSTIGGSLPSLPEQSEARQLRTGISPQEQSLFETPIHHYDAYPQRI